MGQRVHHFNHGWDRAAIGLGSLAFPLGAAVVASMVAHHEVVPVPFALWAAVTALLVTSVAMRTLLYRAVIGCGLADTVRAGVCTKSLTYTIILASLHALLRRRIPWRRTDKFKTRASALRGVRSSWPEAALATMCFGLAGAVWLLVPHPGVLLMLAIGAALQGFRLVAAPVLALESEWRLRAAARQELGTVDVRHRSLPRLRPHLRPVRLLVAAVALAALIAATCVVLIRLVTYTEPIRSAAGGATLSRGDGGTAHSPATTETVQPGRQLHVRQIVLAARASGRTVAAPRRPKAAPARPTLLSAGGKIHAAVRRLTAPPSTSRRTWALGGRPSAPPARANVAALSTSVIPGPASVHSPTHRRGGNTSNSGRRHPDPPR